MSEKENILLFSCPPDFKLSLEKVGYHVDQGGLWDRDRPPDVDDSWVTGYCFAHPKRLYEYEYVVYCPYQQSTLDSDYFSLVEQTRGMTALPDFNESIKGGTVCIVFINKNLEPIESLSRNVDPSDPAVQLWLRGRELPVEEQKDESHVVYTLLCRYIEKYLIVDKKTQLVSNDIAEFFKPILEKYILEEHLRLPITSLKERFPQSNKDFFLYPVSTNKAGHYHSVWIKHGAGGILYLPEFKNNLEVLTALLNLPLSKLLEINADLSHHRDQEPDSFCDVRNSLYPPESDGETAKLHDPLPKAPRLLYEKLKSLKPHEAMTTDEILDWLSNKHEKHISESTLYKTYLKPLKPYGLKNKPKTGYYIRED